MYHDTQEMGWNDIISNDEIFRILPEGDYNFSVSSYARARHNGSAKLPACNKVILTLRVWNDAGEGEVTCNLFLHRSVEWKLCQFFIAIGQRKYGEAFRMDWNAVPGAAGMCKISRRTWTGNDGRSRESNEVDQFYDPAQHPPIRTPDDAEARGQMDMALPEPARTPWSEGRF